MKSAILCILTCAVFGFAFHHFTNGGNKEQSHNSLAVLSLDDWASICERIEDFSDTRQLLGAPVKSRELLEVLRDNNIDPEAFRKAGAQALTEALKDITPASDTTGTIISRPDGEDVRVSLDEDHDAHASMSDSLALRLLYGLPRSSKGP